MVPIQSMTDLRDRASKASSELQSIAHVTVSDVDVDSSETAPEIELELESRGFSVLYQISGVLDKFDLRVDSVESEQPEIVRLVSDESVAVSEI